MLGSFGPQPTTRSSGYAPSHYAFPQIRFHLIKQNCAQEVLQTREFDYCRNRLLYYSCDFGNQRYFRSLWNLPKGRNMPSLKRRSIFISHAWKHDEQYWALVNWFDEEPNFSWKNYSVPSHDGCLDPTESGLRTCLTNQMKPAQGIIILAGMYATYSDWIDYEIDEAVRMGKTIIAVRPWGQERTPRKVQNAANIMVNWNKSSIIRAIRDLV
jgi:hypothetical protein